MQHLRQFARTVIHRCNSCKIFQVINYFAPVPGQPGQLPTGKTNGYRTFRVVGLHYADSIFYKGKRTWRKPIFYLCSLSRAVPLELVQSQKLEELIICFKRFAACRGKPHEVYSDNAKAFKSAAEWIKAIIKSEMFQDYLSENCIKWQYNLSRAPWWEWWPNYKKQCLYKSIGKTNLKEILLNIESTLNCRFSYAGTWELVNLFVRTKKFIYHICYENISRKHNEIFWHLN